jgi:hypothetical protein
MNATEKPTAQARKLETPLPHPALVHPPIDPALVALQLGCLGERSVVARRGSFEVRALGAPIERELRIELGRLREQRARLAGRGTGRPADLDDVELRCVHVVVWCTERQAIAAAACVLDPRDARASLRVVDGCHDGRSGTIDVARSFVSVGFGETDAAVALLRGIDAWLAAPAPAAAAAE